MPFILEKLFFKLEFKSFGDPNFIPDPSLVGGSHFEGFIAKKACFNPVKTSSNEIRIRWTRKVKKYLICLEGKSIIPRWARTILLRSLKQLVFVMDS